MVLSLSWQSPSGALRRSILALVQLCTPANLRKRGMTSSWI